MIHNKGLTVFFFALFFSSYGFSQSIEWIAQPKYDAISPFHEGVAAINVDGKWGYINRQGKEIVKPEYDKVFDFNDGVGVITTADLEIKAIADKSGNLTIIKSVLKADQRFAQFGDGLLLVTDGKKWGYLNKSGNLQIDCKYATAFPFSEDLAAVTLSVTGWDSWAYIKPSGNVAIVQDNKIDWASSFYNGKAVVVISRQLASIDIQGKRIKGNIPELIVNPNIQQKYDKLTGELKLKEGIATFNGHGRLESIETQATGKQTFLTPENKSENSLIQVKTNGSKSGFIINGKSTPCQFDEVSWFDKTTAIVKKGLSFGIISLDENNSISVTLKKDTIFSVFGNPASATLVVKNLKPKELSNLKIKISDTTQQGITSLKPEESKELVLSLTKNTDASSEEKEIEVQPDLGGILQNPFKIKTIIRDKPSLRIEFTKSSFKGNLGEKITVTFNITNESDNVAENVTTKVFEKSVSIYDNIKSIQGKGVATCQFSITGSQNMTKELEIIVRLQKSPPIRLIKKITLKINIEKPLNPQKEKINTEVHL